MAEVTKENITLTLPTNAVPGTSRPGITLKITGTVRVNTVTGKTEFLDKNDKVIITMSGSDGTNFSDKVVLSDPEAFLNAVKEENKNIPNYANDANVLKTFFNSNTGTDLKRTIKRTYKDVATDPTNRNDTAFLKSKFGGQSPLIAGISLPQQAAAAPGPAAPGAADDETASGPLSTITGQSENPFTNLGVASIGKEFNDTFSGVSSLVYPTGLKNLEQDYVKFRTFRYKPQTITGEYKLVTDLYEGSGEGPTIFLPTSGGIQDNNTVSWGPNTINPIQIAMYKEAYGLIGTPDIGQQLADLEKRVIGKLSKSSASLATATATYFASQAAGVNNLLSRTSGAIFNPNLSLLFNNPELRSFSFRYVLSPRDTNEARTVRKIIRWFKQSMAVRRDAEYLFLLTPNVYRISYHPGNDSNHKAIGRVKTCALVGCNVNYVPDGSYMTYEDSAKTMTSYEMSLSFNELDPIYYDEYDEIPSDEIGY